MSLPHSLALRTVSVAARPEQPQPQQSLSPPATRPRSGSFDQTARRPEEPGARKISSPVSPAAAIIIGPAPVAGSKRGEVYV